VGPRAGLDTVQKRKFLPLPGLELRPLGCPARRQSLYRMRYPGSLVTSLYTGKTVCHFESLRVGWILQSRREVVAKEKMLIFVAQKEIFPICTAKI
jgi:hypothetical protein